MKYGARGEWGMPTGPVPLFLAPMAGVTDLAYRLLASECGADFTMTEFTAASGLSRKEAKSWLKMDSHPREHPFIPQIFGGDENEMVSTVRMLQDRADIIDINFGCPAPKVCRNNAGAALLKNPDRVVHLVRSCIQASNIPISVKMRLGTGSGPDTALEISKRLENEGVIRVCVHGRTLRQRYSGIADWSSIRQIVDSVSIPVIANGDVIDSRTAVDCLESTGAAGLMIGRAAIGRPMIFHEIKRDLGWTNENPPWDSEDVVVARRWCWERYLQICSEVYGVKGSKNSKRHAVSFTKGLPGASSMRVALHRAKNHEDLGEMVSEYLRELEEDTIAA